MLGFAKMVCHAPRRILDDMGGGGFGKAEEALYMAGLDLKGRMATGFTAALLHRLSALGWTAHATDAGAELRSPCGFDVRFDEEGRATCASKAVLQIFRQAAEEAYAAPDAPAMPLRMGRREILLDAPLNEELQG